MNHVTLVEHPLVRHALTILRDKETQGESFYQHGAIVSQIVILEAIKHVRLEEKTVVTPLAPFKGSVIGESLVFVPVLRAGLAMLSPAKEFLPWVPVGFIGLERDEDTAVARKYYQKFPQGLTGKHVLVLDPMLATGGSLVDTIDALKEQGAETISAVCIVAAPEGIAYLHKKFPDVEIYTAAIDSHLNEVKYIVPGLGDFGDRYFGT